MGSRRRGTESNTYVTTVSFFEEEIEYLKKIKPGEILQDVIRKFLFKDMYRENFLTLNSFIDELSESLCQTKERKVNTICLLIKEEKDLLVKHAKNNNLRPGKFVYEVLKEKTVLKPTVLEDEENFEDYIFDYSHEFSKVRNYTETHSSIYVQTTQEEKNLILTFSRRCGIGTGKLLYEMLKRKGVFTEDFTLAEKLESSVIEIP